MFLIALNKRLRDLSWFEKNKKNEPKLIEYLDLVSLGTVCDVVPLVGLNRAIVSQGLKIMKKKSNLGLRTNLSLVISTILIIIFLTFYFKDLPGSLSDHFHVSPYYHYSIPVALIIALIFLNYFANFLTKSFIV